MNPIPASARHRSTPAGSRSIFTPSDSGRSADPRMRGGGPVAVFGDRDAGTSDDQGLRRVEMLRCAAPIPTRAARVDHRLRCLHGVANSSIVRARPSISSTGLAFRAEGRAEARRSACRGGLAGPWIDERIASAASSGPEVFLAREPQQEFRPEIGVRMRFGRLGQRVHARRPLPAQLDFGPVAACGRTTRVWFALAGTQASQA